MDIYSLLPLLDGWKYEPRDFDLIAAPEVILPGETFDLTPVMKARGWFIGTGIWLDNQFARLIARYDEAIVDTSPFGVRLAGQIQPQNIGTWVSRYDTTVIPHIFVMLMTPSIPIPFRKEFRAFILNPAVRPDGTPNDVARLYAYTLTTLEIIDTDAFIRSFQRLYPSVAQALPPPIAPSIMPAVEPLRPLPPLPPLRR